MEFDFRGVPLADEELDQLRGGFLRGDLEISIGLDQIVTFNGEELVVNRLTIPNLNQRVSGRAMDYSHETVIQILRPDQTGGARVATNPSVGGQGWTTVIQNNLNDSVIQNIHQLNIELDNLAVSHQMPLHLGEHLNRLLSR
ncbi:hypothetical protein [Marinobacter daqiaonensis]|uniref:hypothetical protein n=1 Tax=Marinobacter daqiaonensis TaxID=650891 RepID=UPI000B897227|nr:hypothetical protein [Marinobacter daqiaonensis]